MHTWAIFVALPRPSAESSSTFKILMRHCQPPGEWDLKRLAASFVLVCRSSGLGESVAREAVLTCVRSYRDTMARFSTMRALDVWYARFDADTLVAQIADQYIRSRTRKSLDKAKNLCIVEDVFPKLADKSGRGPDHQGQSAAHPPPPQAAERTSSLHESKRSSSVIANRYLTTGASC